MKTITDEIELEISEDIEGGGTFSVTFEGPEAARIDKALSEQIEELSRSRIQALIEQGHVRVNGTPCTSASRKLAAGDSLEVDIPPPEPWHPVAEDIPLEIIYEDDDLLVINKQAGLVVHPGAGNKTGTLVNALLHHCEGSLSGIGGVLRPGIVHRLDKDTTGLMVVAKNDAAHKGLSAQFGDRTLSRSYKALVLGIPMPPRGTVDKPIGRHPANRQKMAPGARGGKEARTHYTVEERYRDTLCLLDCRLETGRTHQIRVHMAFAGYPLVGDPLYGPQRTALAGAMKKGGYSPETIETALAFPRQALHAYALTFIHPLTDEEMDFEAPLPDDMKKLLALT